MDQCRQRNARPASFASPGKLGDLDRVMVTSFHVLLALHVLCPLKRPFLDRDKVLHYGAAAVPQAPATAA